MSEGRETGTTALSAVEMLKQGGLSMGPHWEEAHALCQAQEGDFAHDLVHALCHWIEGDTGNRDYWYRRCGQTAKRAATIEDEWQRISRLIR